MRTVLLFLAVLVLSCKANKDRETCNPDFDVFFRKFAGDSIFQKSHMDFPVMHYYSDEDFPLDLMEDMIDEDEYAFTDFTDDKNLYDISVDRKKDSVIYTRTWRESYGVMVYKFASRNNCWKLVEVRDITD